MSTLTYARPQITRVDLAPHTKIQNSMVQSANRTPFQDVLRPMPHMNVKPHVPYQRHNIVRNSGDNHIVLPKLHTPGRNRSIDVKTDMLSPVRRHAAPNSVRNLRGPAAIITEAKLMSQRAAVPSLPPNHALKNFTALELSRFIDKRLTDVAKSNINYNRQNGDDNADLYAMADDQQGKSLRAKLYGGAGRKELISNQTNFTNIDNPFGDYSLTLQTVKREKHEEWKIRKAEKTVKLKQQIQDMEKKLKIYRKYKDDLGVTLSKTERDNVLNNFSCNGVELLMGRKMFTMRQTQAAVRIQSWWKKAKLRAWFSLISNIRRVAVTKIQRTWRVYLRLRVWPEMLKANKDQAATVLQKRMRGYSVRKQYWQDISMNRMKLCFEYFGEMQDNLQKDAAKFIAYHMAKYAKRRIEERRIEEEEEKKQLKNNKNKKNGKNQHLSIQTQATGGKRGSISKTARQAATIKQSVQSSNNATSSKGKLATANVTPKNEKVEKNAVEKSSFDKAANEKSDSAFVTQGLKRDNSQSGKSGTSLHHQKSAESLNNGKQKTVESATEKSVKQDESIQQAQKILLNDGQQLIQSQEEMRMNSTSPLEVATDGNLATQEIKAAFVGEGAVIHEVDEENNPEDLSEAQRHSILKGEKGRANSMRSSKNSKGAHGTKKNFNRDERIKKSMDSESLQKEKAEMQATGQPTKDLDSQKIADLRSTGDVNVKIELQQPDNQETIHMQDTVQAEVAPNVQRSEEETSVAQQEQSQADAAPEEMIALLKQAFDEMDENKNGRLEKGEAMVFIEQYVIGKFFPDLKGDADSVWNTILGQVDEDHDGKLSFEEFKTIFFDNNEQQHHQQQHSQDQSQSQLHGDSSQAQIAHNFSQDKLSMGATDQPVSQSMIPGKLEEEQPLKMEQIAQLNKSSEDGSRGTKRQRSSINIQDNNETPELKMRQSQGMSMVQRSQEKAKIRTSQTLNKSQNGSFKVQSQSNRRSQNSQQQKAQLPSSHGGGNNNHPSVKQSSGSIKLKKDEITRVSGGQVSQRSSVKKSPSVVRSSTKISKVDVLKQRSPTKELERVDSRHSVASRQSVRELAEQKRPNEGTNGPMGEEKGDKFSAYADSVENKGAAVDGGDQEKQMRQSFEGLKINDDIDLPQQNNSSRQQDQQLSSEKGADPYNQKSSREMSQADFGTKQVEEKGDNNKGGRYDDNAEEEDENYDDEFDH